MEIEKETTGEGERRRSIGEELHKLVCFFLRLILLNYSK
jgi:hypothetical protein